MTGSASPSPLQSFLPPPPPRSSRSIGALLGLSMRRQGGRRAMSVLTALLVVAGLGMFAFPAITDLFGQYYRQTHVQNRLSDPTFRTLYEEHKVKVGEGLTQLIINNDRVKVNVMVVQGTTLAALQAGAGHYVDTPLPCEQGNVGIAGHRTTYGRPFNKIDEMRPGDTVTLVTPFARCIYQVVRPSEIVVPAVVNDPKEHPFQPTVNPFVVLPDDHWVVSQEGALGTGHWLTLTSCHPKGEATHRIVLRLKLVKEIPIVPKTKAKR
jgi:sortase A